MDTEISIEAKWIKKDRVKATAWRGEVAVFSDEFNPATTTGRKRFLRGLREKVPALEGDEDERQRIDDALVQIAAERHEGDDGAAPDAEMPDVEKLLAEMPQEARADATAMLQDPELIARVIEDIAELGVAGEHELVATLYLVGTSRLLERPAAAIVQGPTSSGKSFIIQRVAMLFPPEAVVHATQMTPQALYHMRPGALVHRFLVAGERAHAQNDDTADATKALREMISEGWLVKQVPEKVEGQGIVTVEKRVDGPIAYIESTTISKVFEEDANRCILLSTDERPGQTRRVLAKLATGYVGGAGKKDRERIIAKHHAAQRMLRSCEVVVPYADALAEHFPSERPEARRAYSHLMAIVIASALLHCHQRRRNQDENVIASQDDYVLAERLLGGPLGRFLGGSASEAAMRMHERLKEWASGQVFTTPEAWGHEDLSDRAVRGFLRELERAGLVELVEEARGSRSGRWQLVTTPAASKRDTGLPDPALVFGGSFCPSDKGQQIAVTEVKSEYVPCSE